MKISDGKYRHHPQLRSQPRLHVFLLKWLGSWRRATDRPASAADIAPYLKRDIGIHDGAGTERR